MPKYPELSISNTLRVIGSSSFIRHVAIPLYEEIDELAELFEPYDGRLGADLDARTRPQAELIAFGGLATIGLFVSGWAAGKVLDEIYEQLLRPRIEKVFRKFFANAATGKVYGVSLLIADASKNFKILVVSVGSNIEELAASDSLVPQVIQAGLNYAEAMQSHRKVHTYIISYGQFNSTPFIFNTIRDAERALCSGKMLGRQHVYVKHDP